MEKGSIKTKHYITNLQIIILPSCLLPSTLTTYGFDCKVRELSSTFVKIPLTFIAVLLCTEPSNKCLVVALADSLFNRPAHLIHAAS